MLPLRLAGARLRSQARFSDAAQGTAHALQAESTPD